MIIDKMIKLKKGGKTISEKIQESLKPDEKLDIEEDEDHDGSSAKIVQFDEEVENFLGSGPNEFRKKNIKYLNEFDSKYQGNISSRHEIFGESGDEDSDDTEEKRLDLADDSDESVVSNEEDNVDISENDDEVGKFVRAKPTSDDSDDAELGSEDQEYGEEDNSSASEDETQVKSISLSESNIINHENTSETQQKGIAVQNQLKMWEKLLEIRIKSQKPLTVSNALPTKERFKAYYDSEKLFKEKANTLNDTLGTVLENLIGLQDTLVSNFSDTKELFKATTKRKNTIQPQSNKKHKIEDFEVIISTNYTSYTNYRNDVIQKWYDRTKIIGNLKNQKHDQNILRKIENSLINKDELVKKTQLFRGGYKLFDDIKADISLSNDDENESTSNNIYSPEIFDDSDFYHQLLRELIEFKTNSSDNLMEITNKFAELQKVRNKMKKKVDTRASKGRKIRYIVHNKMINFMAPVQDFAWTDESKTELFNSIFGNTGNKS